MFVFFDEFQSIAYSFFIDRQLFVSFHIHEVVQSIVTVQILHVLSLYVSSWHFIGWVEGFLQYGSCYNILYFGSNKSCSFARLYMLKFNNLINLSISSSNSIPSQLIIFVLIYNVKFKRSGVYINLNNAK